MVSIFLQVCVYSLDLAEIQSVATSFWFVEVHAKFILYK